MNEASNWKKNVDGLISKRDYKLEIKMYFVMWDEGDDSFILKDHELGRQTWCKTKVIIINEFINNVQR